MAYNFPSASPAMVIPSLPPQNYFPLTDLNASHSASAMEDASAPSSDLPAAAPIALAPGSLAGRKRSRGGDHSPDDELLDDGSLRTPNADVMGSSMSDHGMMVDPSHSHSAPAHGGPPSMFEMNGHSSNLTQSHRPAATTRKSQRVEAPSAAQSDDLAQLLLPPQTREATAEPLIDEATRVLGISWTRMDSSEVLRITQAAYSKWIQNHYAALTNVAVWFENSSLPGYLVAATNAHSRAHEYYIFNDQLTEARLVTSDPTCLVPRLRMLPSLHLAAPGGVIHAETDPAVVSQNEVNEVQTAAEPEFAQPEDMCTAHSMELD